ncbi:flagellar biosynthetic protein FliO [Achromobacter sp. GG226]|uniref:flagellar biosynthetic protein FliO n=1 Tax=Verticiella alkaliphila TaxID=2779529 RepID=UPI001C0DFE68|nr:flagellar biosynthetic protein FliO [Verticiella sp. GG226]MBU4610492.1 flagellar biosynthetic protein FliO [Verticiella sp. GG226]
MRSHLLSRLSTAAACLLTATPALAQTDPLAGGAMMVRAMLGLAVVIGLILLCAWAARRMGIASRATAGMPARLVGSMALGPRERVIVLQVEDTWLVVGVTPGGMQTLHTLPATPEAPANTTPTAPVWRDVLQRAVGRRPER